MQLPSDPRSRRRRAGLLALAAVSLAAGVAAGSGGGDGGQAPAPAPRAAVEGAADGSPDPAGASGDASALEAAKRRVRRLPLTRLAGSVIVLRFAGPTAPGYVTSALRRKRAAGAILFRDNAPSQASVRRLTRRLQRAAGGDALICADQEGGAIRILPWAPPAAGQNAQTDPAASSRAAARALRRAGVNVSLAPVADLGGPGPVMRTRAYPGGPAQVARSVRAAVRAFEGTGVAPTVKHFPGLGAAPVNTDDAPATVRRGARELGATDLPPFRAAVTAGVPLVMAGHARYPALDPDRIASQSREIVTGLLRDRLGFEGVVITDSLEAAAVTAVTPPERAAIRSIDAGADLMLLTGPGSYIRVLRAVYERARASRAFRERLVTASARVRLLRDRLAR